MLSSKGGHTTQLLAGRRRDMGERKGEKKPKLRRLRESRLANSRGRQDTPRLLGLKMRECGRAKRGRLLRREIGRKGRNEETKEQRLVAVVAANRAGNQRGAHNPFQPQRRAHSERQPVNHDCHYGGARHAPETAVTSQGRPPQRPSRKQESKQASGRL